MSASVALFDALALLAALFACAAVAQRDPVRAVLAFFATSSSLVGCFVVLRAESVGALQWLIVSASMCVLLIFALTWPAEGVAGLREKDPARLARGSGAIALLLGFALLASQVLRALPALTPAPEEFGQQRALGAALLSEFGLPLQMLGLLLLAVVLGALVLARDRGRS